MNKFERLLRLDYADFMRWVGAKLLIFADWLERIWR